MSTIKFFKISLFFLVILYLVLLNLSVTYDDILKSDPTKKFNWIYSKKDQVYDFCVLGSSRGACNMNIQVLDSALGQKGINISLVGSSFAELKIIFESFLKKNTTKKLLLEVDIFGLDKSNFGHPYHEFEYFPYMNEDFIYKDLKNNFGNQAVLWKYIPFYKYAAFNSVTGMTGIVSIIKKNQSDYDQNGDMLLDSAANPFELKYLENKSPTEYKIDEERVNSLKQLVSLAEERKIEIVMYIAPSYSEAAKYQSNRQNIIDFYSAFAKEHNFNFYDFTKEEMCKNINYFIDLEHTNKPGAIEFSKIFSKVLMSVK